MEMAVEMEEELAVGTAVVGLEEAREVAAAG